MPACKGRLLTLLLAGTILAGTGTGAAEQPPKAGASVGPTSWGPGSSYVEVSIDDTSG